MNISGIRSGMALVIVLLLGLAAFAAVTSGFAAVTSDGARRVQLERHPRELPDLLLIDSHGQKHSLASLGSAPGRVTFISLVYLKCQTICRTSMSGQSWMQHAIQARGLEQKVQLLTLSFDPRNDVPQVMAEHAKRLGADTSFWRFATVADPRDLARMLKLFDVIVLPDGLGGYAHNAALFLVDEQGKLSRAYEVERPDLALTDHLARVEGRRR